MQLEFLNPTHYFLAHIHSSVIKNIIINEAVCVGK